MDRRKVTRLLEASDGPLDLIHYIREINVKYSGEVVQGICRHESTPDDSTYLTEFSTHLLNFLQNLEDHSLKTFR